MGLFNELRSMEKAAKKPVKESVQTTAVAPSPEKSKVDYIKFGESKEKKGYVCPKCGSFLEESCESGCPNCQHPELREVKLIMEDGDLVDGVPPPQDEPQSLENAIATVISFFEEVGCQAVIVDANRIQITKDDKSTDLLINLGEEEDGDQVVVASCAKTGYATVGDLKSEEDLAKWADKVVSGTVEFLAQAPAPDTSTEEVPPAETSTEEVPPAEQVEVTPTDLPPVAESATTPLKEDEGDGEPGRQNPENVDPEPPVAPGAQEPESIPVDQPNQAAPEDTLPDDGVEGTASDKPKEKTNPDATVVKLACPDCSGEFTLDQCKSSGSDVVCPDCGAVIESFEVPGEDTLEIDPASVPETPLPNEEEKPDETVPPVSTPPTTEVPAV